MSILEEINTQAENNPLTKEELKKQFVEKTKDLDLKHSFNFDEAWEIGQELTRRQTFRNKIVGLEEQMVNHPSSMSKKEIQEKNPVKHSFADGCYIREIFNPAGELLITKIIIYTHTDCVFVTVHATEKKDIKEIEEDVIADNFNDPVISIEELKILTKK